MNNPFPHELALGDVYYSPLLLVVLLAFIAAVVTVLILNKLKLSHFFYAPSYVFVSITVLYIVLIDTYWIKF